ncbi:MAG: ATP-binding protein [Magnetococcales bacterium]|nr:ATP-binding protein [Magnetococcales bacterium]
MNVREQEQLLLPLSAIPTYTFDNFIVGPENRLAFHEARKFSQGTSASRSMIIVGEGGAGKTHLLSACIYEQEMRNVSCVYIHSEEIVRSLSEVEDKEGCLQILSHYQHYSFIAIDAFELLEDVFFAQEYMIYLYNVISSKCGRMLIGSRTDPGSMKGLRSELKSRLLWGLIITLQEPGDEELYGIIKKIAGDKGIRLSDELVHFLMMRLPRSIGNFERVIALLDRQSLRLSRNIAIPFAKELFDL